MWMVFYASWVLNVSLKLPSGAWVALSTRFGWYSPTWVSSAAFRESLPAGLNMVWRVGWHDTERQLVV